MIDNLVDRVRIENHDREVRIEPTNFTSTRQSKTRGFRLKKNRFFTNIFTGFNNPRLEEETSFADEYKVNDGKLSNENDAVAFKEQVSVSGWFQFWIILHKTIICILRDKVGRLLISLICVTLI